MRWFVRAIVALTLSTVGVAALTRAGWPRPRFVVPLPAMGPRASFFHDIPGPMSSDVQFPAYRFPWLGFQIKDYAGHGEVQRQAFWFVNLEDGRTAGPWEILTVNAFAWDHRGAAIVRGVVPADDPDLESIGRFDPETMQYRRLVGDRGRDFLVSGRGTVLVTSHPDRGLSHRFGADGPGEEDFVCYDLTEDPLRPVRMALVVPHPKRPHNALKESVRTAFGGVAVSPDGRTLAVSDYLRASAHPWGITLLDTRTGAVLRRLTDLGPWSVSADSGPEDLQFTNDGRHLKFVWTANPRVWRSSSDFSSNWENHEQSGRLRVFDLAAGVVIPEGGFRELNRSAQSPDGSLRVETDPPYRDLLTGKSTKRPTAMRVVDLEGAGKSPWRALTIQESAAITECPTHSPLVPDTTGYVVVLPGMLNPPTPWAMKCRKWLGLRPAPLVSEAAWIDWANDRRQVLRVVPGDGYNGNGINWVLPRLYVGPGRIAIMQQGSETEAGTVEIWDAPPPRPPWPWSVPAGVAFGVLLTTIGVRLRRPKSTRT